MGELGGFQKYLYWSGRRIIRWLEGSNVKIPKSSQRKLTTPNFVNLAPPIESQLLQRKIQLARGPRLLPYWVQSSPELLARGWLDVLAQGDSVFAVANVESGEVGFSYLVQAGVKSVD